jgi:hypothetical protein
MRLTSWLRIQVERLEGEIREHPVFATSDPATPADLADLRSKVALHTYLKQQLLRREVLRVDTLEVELAPVLLREA